MLHHDQYLEFEDIARPVVLAPCSPFGDNLKLQLVAKPQQRRVRALQWTLVVVSLGRGGAGGAAAIARGTGHSVANRAERVETRRRATRAVEASQTSLGRGGARQRVCRHICMGGGRLRALVCGGIGLGENVA